MTRVTTPPSPAACTGAGRIRCRAAPSRSWQQSPAGGCRPDTQGRQGPEARDAPPAHQPSVGGPPAAGGPEASTSRDSGDGQAAWRACVRVWGGVQAPGGRLTGCGGASAPGGKLEADSDSVQGAQRTSCHGTRRSHPSSHAAPATPRSVSPARARRCGRCGVRGARGGVGWGSGAHGGVDTGRGAALDKGGCVCKGISEGGCPVGGGGGG